MRHRRKAGGLTGYRLPLFLSMFLWWGVLVFVLTKVDPLVLADFLLPGLYLPFLVIVWICIVITLFYFGGVFWRALLWSSLVLIFLLLSLVDLASWLNIGLLLLLGVVVEVYMRHPGEEAQAIMDSS